VIDIAERTIIMERTEPLAYGSLIKKLDHNKSKWKIPVQICDESIQQYFQGAASEDYASWSSYNKDKLENSSKYKGLH